MDVSSLIFISGRMRQWALGRLFKCEHFLTKCGDDEKCTTFLSLAENIWVLRLLNKTRYTQLGAQPVNLIHHAEDILSSLGALRNYALGGAR